ncbi:nucleoside hydrolase [Pelomonas sp. SE-A7]|uniref:nucleoside hydrolase n=1 Tax=Pelomonas sp. SE-A7 TaxID=3054953 RepID=UPI00259CCE7C|nr:nucleoside hydrolase [Pelomonas sp. SE-A7]MDM4764942.1 nucleoside hydrolase [Pelomonas sp. SE-A7]
MSEAVQHQVIFDTDPGIDDAMALFLLARHPSVRMRAITAAFGNAAIETTARNALALAGYYGLDVPVAAGAAGPLQAVAQRDFPAHVHGEDALGGMYARLPRTQRFLDSRPAHELICDLVNAEPGQITLVAVGPMTNLALALRHDPGIAAKVRQVVVMAGAFGTHGHGGNVSPVAEANVINDPEAADLVFTAAWPVVIIGLDVTQEVVMKNAFLATLRGKGQGVGDFLWEATRHYQDFYDERDGIDGIYSHDASAAAYVIAPSLFKLRSGPVRVVQQGIAIGQTIQDHGRVNPGQTPWSGCPRQHACIGVDADGVRRLFAAAFD